MSDPKQYTRNWFTIVSIMTPVGAKSVLSSSLESMILDIISLQMLQPQVHPCVQHERPVMCMSATW